MEKFVDQPNLGEYYARDHMTWKVVGVYMTPSGERRIRLASIETNTLKVVQLPVFQRKYRKLSRRHTAYRGYH